MSKPGSKKSTRNAAMSQGETDDDVGSLKAQISALLKQQEEQSKQHAELFNLLKDAQEQLRQERENRSRSGPTITFDTMLDKYQAVVDMIKSAKELPLGASDKRELVSTLNTALTRKPTIGLEFAKGGKEISLANIQEFIEPKKSKKRKSGAAMAAAPGGANQLRQLANADAANNAAAAPNPAASTDSAHAGHVQETQLMA